MAKPSNAAQPAKKSTKAAKPAKTAPAKKPPVAKARGALGA